MVTEGVFTPAHVLAEAIRRREVSSVEVVEAYLAQIARHNPDLNAVVTLDEEGARMRERTRRSRGGRSGARSTACRSPWRMPILPRGCVRPGADCHVWQTTSRKRTAPSRPGSRRLGLSSWARPAGQRSGPTRYSPEPTTPGTSLIRRVARAPASVPRSPRA